MGEFAKNRARTDGLQTQCRTCVKATNARHYKKNAEVQKERSRRYVEANQVKVWEYLAKHPCVACGEDDPVVLEFDHREPKEKTMAISAAIFEWSWMRIAAEIEKCDVLCANCHRRKTARQRGYFKWSLSRDSNPEPID